jgi:diadenosine tetraphosphate (Ap4A) HIT family hydrolase
MMDQSVSYLCPKCSFELWLPIANLRVSTLGLNSDARFPGRCLLVLNEHREDFDEMDSVLASAFVDDARLAAHAIKSATKAPRVNYAIFGNRVPHIHFHLIPRAMPSDPIPNQSPWEHPERQKKLDEKESKRLVAQIRTELVSIHSL